MQIEQILGQDSREPDGETLYYLAWRSFFAEPLRRSRRRLLNPKDLETDRWCMNQTYME